VSATFSPAARDGLGLVVGVAGVALVTVGVIGARGKLPRNSWVGLRTPATMASDAAFTAANRAAAVPVAIMGGAAVVGAALLVAGIARTVPQVVVTLGSVALTLLAMAIVAMVRGNRAAGSSSDPDDTDG
jgi:uncharacterized membrane protein